MNAPEPRVAIPTVIGTQTEIGLCFAHIRVGDALYALYQPPMAVARLSPAVWNGNRKCVEDAYSFSDGYVNTVAMAKAGSRIAQQALDAGMYIPSLDESDLQYRAFKPGAQENNCWMRTGINLNAEKPLPPYTPDFPRQTEIDAYRSGNAEAFAEKLHWTSTESRADHDYAWAQYFDYGLQVTYH